MFQKHQPDQSKTGTSSSSIRVGFEEVRARINQSSEVCSLENPDEFVFGLSNPDVMAESAESVDILVVPNRSRRTCFQSVQLYEKGGRLTQ